jgi:hypothetical protein
MAPEITGIDGEQARRNPHRDTGRCQDHVGRGEPVDLPHASDLGKLAVDWPHVDVDRRRHRAHLDLHRREGVRGHGADGVVDEQQRDPEHRDRERHIDRGEQQPSGRTANAAIKQPEHQRAPPKRCSSAKVSR